MARHLDRPAGPRHARRGHHGPVTHTIRNDVDRGRIAGAITTPAPEARIPVRVRLDLGPGVERHEDGLAIAWTTDHVLVEVTLDGLGYLPWLPVRDVSRR